MKFFVAILAVLALAFFASPTMAAKAKGQKKAKTVAGVVAEVQQDGKIKIEKKIKKTGETQEIVVETDANTTVTLDGAEAKVSDIKKGMHVKVTPATGTATKIEAKSPKAKKAGKGKKKADQ